MAGESKCPTLASYVEKPPSERVENEWQIASNQPMPARRRLPMHASVIRKYTNHSARAVCVMRGVSFSSLTGPGVSAL